MNEVLPDVKWCIKSDGWDVIAGLTESMRLEWSGDVDLNDGRLQKQYDEYMKRVNLVQHINRQFSATEERRLTIKDLPSFKLSIVNDLSYIDKSEFIND